MIVGVFFLSTGGAWSFSVGDLIIISYAMTVGFDQFFSKKIIIKGTSAIVVTSIRFIVGAIGMFIVVVLMTPLSFIGWQASLLSGLFIFLHVLTRNIALSHLKVGIVGSILLLIPVFTALMGVILLHEQITFIQMVGGGGILAGGYLLSRTLQSTPSQQITSAVLLPWLHHDRYFRLAAPYVVGMLWFALLFGGGWLVGASMLTDSSQPQSAPAVARQKVPGSTTRTSVTVSSPTPSPLLDSETLSWAAVRGSTKAEDFTAFLAAFPDTRFIFAARKRLHQLQRHEQRPLSMTYR
jgi:uncharacterized membrane protein